MRRTIISAIAFLCFCSVITAQTGIIEKHPQGPSDGKILTMEDVILSASIRPAGFSFPDGFKKPASSLSAWSEDGSIFLKKDGASKMIVQSEGKGIVYGSSVSRNEFGIENGIFFSPDSTKIAFYRKDESRVSEFPLLDITTRTGTLSSIRYPMNGMASELISLGIYDIASESITWVKVHDFSEERYLTNISWGHDASRIFIQVLDRSQKHLRLNMYDSSDGSFIRTILTEDNEKYVEPSHPLYFINNSWKFIYTTNNRDGYRNLYLCDTLGTVQRITKVDADVQFVTSVKNTVYYTSAEVSPIENHLFKLDLGSRKQPKRLTPEPGWHNIVINNDKTAFLDSYSSFNVPVVANLRDMNGKLIEKVAESDDPLKEYATGEAILGSVKSADGKYDNFYRLFHPKDFDPERKYPVVVYVYGGPHSQMVNNSWLGQIRPWEMYMAQQNYIVYVQDNRGTENRGLEYEQAIHKYCGQAEMEDQMVGVNMLMSLPFVDKDRIGVHGWSYGGFMTISLMTTYPEIFKVGVAGGPVIDWKWYEIMYGERYMENGESNPDGFEKTSLIRKAKCLRGKLLICQGAMDNTVVWQHSLNFIQECIDNNIPVDYFPYPRAEHNVFGKNRVHLMQKVSDYFDDYL